MDAPRPLPPPPPPAGPPRPGGALPPPPPPPVAPAAPPPATPDAPRAAIPSARPAAHPEAARIVSELPLYIPPDDDPPPVVRPRPSAAAPVTPPTEPVYHFDTAVDLREFASFHITPQAGPPDDVPLVLADAPPPKPGGLRGRLRGRRAGEGGA